MKNLINRALAAEKRLFLLLAAAMLAACGCSHKTYIPQAPDYTDATMWFTAGNDAEGTGADIFYVVSTWEEDCQLQGLGVIKNYRYVFSDYTTDRHLTSVHLPLCVRAGGRLDGYHDSSFR